MNHTNAIETLRAMANKSKAANDFFHSLATRERGRGTLTVRAVEQRMKKEGFEHGADEYRSILGAMASLGFGTTKLDRSGRIEGLISITTQVRDIGRAVVEGVSGLSKFATRHKYSPLAMPKPLEVIALPKKEAMKPPVHNKTSELEMAQVKKALLSSVDDLVNTILKDESIPAERRIAAVQQLMQT